MSIFNLLGHSMPKKRRSTITETLDISFNKAILAKIPAADFEISFSDTENLTEGDNENMKKDNKNMKIKNKNTSNMKGKGKDNRDVEIEDVKEDEDSKSMKTENVEEDKNNKDMKTENMKEDEDDKDVETKNAEKEKCEAFSKEDDVKSEGLKEADMGPKSVVIKNNVNEMLINGWVVEITENEKMRKVNISFQTEKSNNEIVNIITGMIKSMENVSGEEDDLSPGVTSEENGGQKVDADEAHSDDKIRFDKKGRILCMKRVKKGQRTGDLCMWVAKKQIGDRHYCWNHVPKKKLLEMKEKCMVFVNNTDKKCQNDASCCIEYYDTLPTCSPFSTPFSSSLPTGEVQKGGAEKRSNDIEGIRVYVCLIHVEKGFTEYGKLLLQKGKSIDDVNRILIEKRKELYTKMDD